MDISNVGLSVPFAIIPAQRTEMVRTVARIEAEAQYPVGGVGRYTGDLFLGGKPWSLSGLWLAMYYAEAGDVTAARRHLNWCLKHVMAHDFLPEQSHRQTGLRTSAAPLAWSHAWVVILLQRLGVLRADAGVFPSDSEF
jgi:GH15 family glucan-1,4-alpha-glucosidase